MTNGKNFNFCFANLIYYSIVTMYKLSNIFFFKLGDNSTNCGNLESFFTAEKTESIHLSAAPTLSLAIYKAISVTRSIDNGDHFIFIDLSFSKSFLLQHHDQFLFHQLIVDERSEHPVIVQFFRVEFHIH